MATYIVRKVVEDYDDNRTINGHAIPIWRETGEEYETYSRPSGVVYSETVWEDTEVLYVKA